MVGVCSRRLSWKERTRSDTADAMYRLLIAVLLAIASAVGAPQETNKSGEAYVKIEPVNETTFQNLPPDSLSPFTEPESNGSGRHVRRNEVTTEDQSEAATEVAEAATETSERADLAVGPAEGIKTRTKTQRPRAYSKLSYFQKPNYVSGLSAANILERNSKRKFKSGCRCEKIWNCPKLQITVPRCPDEYFMCCF